MSDLQLTLFQLEVWAKPDAEYLDSDVFGKRDFLPRTPPQARRFVPVDFGSCHRFITADFLVDFVNLGVAFHEAVKSSA